ncbi:MAG: tetratricopeptide repeat protein [Microcoleaceae cyanobacterium]
MAYYTKAIQIEPEFDRIYYRMGEVWSAQNNWKQSISAYRKAIELNPDFPWSYVRLGNAFYQLKQIQKSINVYRKAIKIRPDFAITYHKLGTVLIQMRRWGEVISTYRKAVAQGLTLSAESQYNQGLAYSQKERWGKAVQAYIDAIELEPDSHFWFYRQNFWDVLSRQKKLERVADICTKAAQEKLDSVWCCTNLGKARTLQRRFEEAAQALSAGSYRRAIEIHPEWKAPQVELEKVGKPDFLIIGTQKGGTTSLYYYLCHHPQILPALTKEIEFWSRGAYQGIDWYLSHFLPTPIDQNIVTGEATPSNLDHRGAAESIFEFYPDIKIIVILRNPIDRAISHYHHWFRNSWESRSLEDAVQQQIKKLQSYPDRVWDQANGYIARSTYIHFLRKWMSIFPREQFLILKSEDFYNAPQKVLGETFRFLNLSQYIISEYRCYNSGTYSDTESSVVETLNSYFHPYNQELEDFLEMRFTWEVGV